MHSIPRLKLSLLPFDINLERASKLFLLIMWGLAAYVYFKSPAIIPTHFDFSDKPDDFGDKWILLILPVIATIIYIVFTLLCKYPHNLNYGTHITQENAERQYRIATGLLRYIKLAILIIFSMIILFTHLTTIGAAKGLGVWFLPVVGAMLIIPTIIAISKSLRRP